MENINIHTLAANPVLHPYSKMIKAEAVKSIKIISKYIPIDNVDIIIANIPENIRFGRMSVQVRNKNLAYIAINAKSRNFRKTFRKDLLEAMAYALYRIVRFQKNGYPKNLLEACVDQGLAFHFQTESTGNKSEPHFISTKNLKQLKLVLLKAKKEFKLSNYNHSDWFHGSKKRHIPSFAGYIIGYVLVEHFLKINSSTIPSQLIRKKAKNFLV